MKKVTLILLILVAGMALPAGAHSGTCTASPKKPERGYSNTVLFSSRYGCGTYIHDTITATLIAQRRTPGQPWATVGSDTETARNFDFVWALFSLGSFNCNKDYRVIGGGSASPGGHSASGVVGPVLFHTC